MAFLVLLLSRKNAAHFLTRIRKNITGTETNPKNDSTDSSIFISSRTVFNIHVSL